jgi:predicted nucleotide-binding protein (sugar kinase/HSP70/actin superfamily)
MSQVKFFVEANSYEMFKLWQENKNYDIPCKWDEHHSGFGFTIGRISNRPIVLTFSFATLDDSLVCFYTSSSQLVDHKMIEDFIEFCWPIKYDHGHRRAMTDAQNFHHCIHYCKNPY